MIKNWWNESFPNAHMPATGDQINALLEQVQYAVDRLGDVPAFGDDIGSKVTKAQLGVARNKLKEAAETIQGSLIQELRAVQLERDDLFNALKGFCDAVTMPWVTGKQILTSADGTDTDIGAQLKEALASIARVQGDPCVIEGPHRMRIEFLPDPAQPVRLKVGDSPEVFDVGDALDSAELEHANGVWEPLSSEAMAFLHKHEQACYRYDHKIRTILKPDFDQPFVTLIRSNVVAANGDHAIAFAMVASNGLSYAKALFFNKELTEFSYAPASAEKAKTWLKEVKGRVRGLIGAAALPKPTTQDMPALLKPSDQTAEKGVKR